MNVSKAMCWFILPCLFILFSLPGCHSAKMLRFHRGDIPCEVEVGEKGAEGNCLNAEGTRTEFALWSETSYNYSILAQGLNSEDRPVSHIYGLLINNVEQSPDGEDWKRFLRNPALLCNEACGGGDWLPETSENNAGN